MNPSRPSGTDNATIAQVAAFFQIGTLKLKRAIEAAGIKPTSVAGEERFGLIHILQIAKLPLVEASKPPPAPEENDKQKKAKLALVAEYEYALALQLEWKQWCGVPLTGAEVERSLLGAVRNVFEASVHYEKENKRLEALVVALTLRIESLEAMRKPKKMDERIARVEAEIIRIHERKAA